VKLFIYYITLYNRDGSHGFSKIVPLISYAFAGLAVLLTQRANAAEINKRRISGYLQNGARFGVNKRRFSAYAKQNHPFSRFSSQ
jgi:hypothetical protein